MSTKSSIVWGEDVHFYHEGWDEDGAVYLELRGKDIEFSVSPNEVTIKIPPHIWETIRKTAAVSFKYAEMSDQELLEIVNAGINERLVEYENASETMKPWIAFSGSLIFGGANEPKDKQIEKGFEYYSKLRNIQRKIKEDMALLKVHSR